MNNDETVEPQITADQLLKDILERLRNDDKVDSALVEILSENIVKLNPTENAVNDAVIAMETLASKRAEEPDHDPANHD